MYSEETDDSYVVHSNGFGELAKVLSASCSGLSFYDVYLNMWCLCSPVFVFSTGSIHVGRSFLCLSVCLSVCLFVCLSVLGSIPFGAWQYFVPGSFLSLRQA